MAPQKNASAANAPKPGAGSRLAALATPKGILATAFLIAAVIVYLFTVGPLGEKGLPEATRTPGFGSPLASAPHLVCGDAGTQTKTMSSSAAETLDQIALEGRRNAGGSASSVSLYQISLDDPDETAATQAMITWSRPGSPDPLMQVAAKKAPDGAGWLIVSVTTCG